jgi:hypothetical protein
VFSYKALAHISVMLTYHVDNGLFNAGLTDNGIQTCQATNVFVGYIITADTPVVQLSCIGGYGATFDPKSGEATYQHGSFDGSFETSSSLYNNGDGVYWSANVWGC